jgi:hypothetical protein
MSVSHAKVTRKVSGLVSLYIPTDQHGGGPRRLLIDSKPSKEEDFYSFLKPFNLKRWSELLYNYSRVEKENNFDFISNRSTP